MCQISVHLVSFSIERNSIHRRSETVIWSFFLMWTFVLFTRIFQEMPSFFVTFVFLKKILFSSVFWWLISWLFNLSQNRWTAWGSAHTFYSPWIFDLLTIVAFFQLKCFERGISSAISMASWHVNGIWNISKCHSNALNVVR